MASENPGAFPVLHAVTRLGNRTSVKKTSRERLKALARGVDDDEDLEYKQHGELVHNNSASAVYDVKFYPYTEPDEDAVFAVVAARHVYVYRPSPDPQTAVQLLCVFEDPHEDASLNSLVWSQDIDTGNPLLCFGGAGSGSIKVVDVTRRKFLRNLSGHGAAINDLAISPQTPTILASASADYSIRLWNLEPRFENQPCAAILASPDAHKQSVLALAFHLEGNYLLSGGTDTMINLWAIPTIPSGLASGPDKISKVYFPLFSSTEVHADYVDCLRFYGDLILSHAAATAETSKSSSSSGKNHILLWKIDGFSSAAPVPDLPPYAEPGKYTRSAFGGRFQRLLTFDMPNTSPFYMRFSLFERPDHHKILVMGNEKSRFSFWDFYALEHGPEEAGITGPSFLGSGRRKKSRRGGYRPRGSGVARASSSAAASASGSKTSHDDDGAAVGDSEGSCDEVDDEDGSEEEVEDGYLPGVDRDPSLAPSGTVDGFEGSKPRAGGVARLREEHSGVVRGGRGGKKMSTKQKGRELRFDIADAFKPIAPHYTLTVPKYNFTVRQVAWSNCGKWCVAVGEIGLVCVFKRWV